MGLFSKKKDMDTVYLDLIKQLVAIVENQFNTKVYKYEIVKNGTEEYDDLLPFGVSPPPNAYCMAYLLIPLDDGDNIAYSTQSDPPITRQTGPLKLSVSSDCFFAFLHFTNLLVF